MARTPVVDRLAAEGINYRRAYNQNTVCMPARSTMLTGQYVRTHGVVANGIPLPGRCAVDRPVSPRQGRLPHRLARQGPLRARASIRRTSWRRTPAWRAATPVPGGASSDHSRPCTRPPGVTIRSRTTGAGSRSTIPSTCTASPDCSRPSRAATRWPPRPRTTRSRAQWYHTDWVADLTVEWLGSLAGDEPWFCWMSFPDPHHPWDPPASELHRVPWQDLDLPPGHPGSDDDDPRDPGAQARPLARLLGRHASPTWRVVRRPSSRRG